MAGIYIHIPFCKQACVYCDFHFSTQLNYRDDMMKAIRKEIELQRNFFGNEKQPVLETIYFGGGTPSIIPTVDIERIIDTIYKTFSVSNEVEITLEANPDDLTARKITELRNTPVNRFSIGVQSFFDEDLRFMNRAHNAQESIAAIKRAQDAGFENITIDLIYGIPTLSDFNWSQNINTAVSLAVPHISAYALTVEEKTALHHLIVKEKISPLSDEQSQHQFGMLMEQLSAKGYEQYEISNFCLPGKYSRHNSSYWKGSHYLGIGPSAHSYNGIERRWNIKNNRMYMKSVYKGELSFERENLEINTRYNEYILTRLRTSWGADFKEIEREFGSDYLKQTQSEYEKQKALGNITESNTKLILTEQGKYFADKIASDFFIV